MTLLFVFRAFLFTRKKSLKELHAPDDAYDNNKEIRVRSQIETQTKKQRQEMKRYIVNSRNHSEGIRLTFEKFS